MLELQNSLQIWSYRTYFHQIPRAAAVPAVVICGCAWLQRRTGTFQHCTALNRAAGRLRVLRTEQLIGQFRDLWAAHQLLAVLAGSAAGVGGRGHVAAGAGRLGWPLAARWAAAAGGLTVAVRRDPGGSYHPRLLAVTVLPLQGTRTAALRAVSFSSVGGIPRAVASCKFANLDAGIVSDSGAGSSL